MSGELIVAATGALSAVVWFSVVAIVWVLLYRAAFPRADEEAPASAGQFQPAGSAPLPPPANLPTGAPEPLVDTRPRVACPRCGELVLVEARLCRFCGYRFAEKL